MDITFVDIADPPSHAPRVYVSIGLGPQLEYGRRFYARVHFDQWGATPPSVWLQEEMPLPLFRSAPGGSHYFGIEDTLAADASVDITRISFTPPEAPVGEPMLIALPTVDRIGGATVCPDDSDNLTLGAVIEGAADSASIYWSISVSSARQLPGEVQHHASWQGTGQPIVTVRAAALPDSDTVSAYLRVSVQSTVVLDSTRIETAVDVEERYTILRAAGAC